MSRRMVSYYLPPQIQFLNWFVSGLVFVHIFYLFSLFSGFLTEVIGTVYLTIVPGISLLISAQFLPRRLHHIVYIVSISLLYLIAVGFGASLVVSSPRGVFFPAPFTTTGIAFWIVGPLIFLLPLINSYSKRISINHGPLLTRAQLLGILLPLLTALGAHILNTTSNNTAAITSLSIVVIAAGYTVYMSEDHTSREIGVLIWGTSLALLWLNTIIDTNLAQGDGGFEHAFARVALAEGFYQLTLESIRASSLRLSILHPIYVAGTSLPLNWEMKLVHPLLFSLVPVGIYTVSRWEFNAKIGAYSAFIYVSSFPFFALLGRNTRTGVALFFVTSALLALCDEGLSESLGRGIAGAAGVGVILSHYGIGPLFAFILTIAALLLALSQERRLNMRMLALIAVLDIAWFLYASDGAPLEFVTGVLYHAVSQIGGQSSAASSSGGHSIVFSMPSFTYSFIRIEFALILFFGALGLFGALITRDIITNSVNYNSKWIPNQLRDASDIHVALACGAAWLVPASFLPTAVLGIARIYMIVLLFLAPYSMAVLIAILRTPKRHQVITVFLTVSLILNSGLFAAVSTHDVSPQPNLYRDEIIASGTDTEKYHLFRRYGPDTTAQAGEWIAEHYSQEKIYGGIHSLPSSNPTGNTPYRESIPLVTNKTSCNGSIWISPQDKSIGKIVTDRDPSFSNYDESISLKFLNLTQRDIVYTNGGNTVFAGCKDR